MVEQTQEGIVIDKQADSLMTEIKAAVNKLIAEKKFFEARHILHSIEWKVRGLDNKCGKEYAKEYLSKHYPDMYNVLMRSLGNYIRFYDALYYTKNNKHNRMYVRSVRIVAGSPIGEYIELEGRVDDDKRSVSFKLTPSMAKYVRFVKSRAKPELLAEMRKKMPPSDDLVYNEWQ